MKLSARVTIALLSVLALISGVFQSCGHPAKMAGTGTSDVPVNYKGAPALAPRVFHHQGQCPDPAKPESTIVMAEGVYVLTSENCVDVSSAAPIAPATIVRSQDAIEVAGRVYVPEG